MANDISGAVWRIDTLPFSYPYPVKIANVIWSDAGAAGDSAVMQTVASKPILDQKAYAADYNWSSGFIGWVPSLKVTALDSGVLQIVVGSGK